MQAGPPTEDSVVGDCRMERVTAAIMSGALRYSAADVYDAFATLNELKGRARVELEKVDFLLVPSAAHHYTIAGGLVPKDVTPLQISLPACQLACACCGTLYIGQPA